MHGTQQTQGTVSKHIMGHTVFKSAVQGSGQQLDQSEFLPMAEVFFPVLVSPANARRKETSASREVIQSTVHLSLLALNCN